MSIQNCLLAALLALASHCAHAQGKLTVVADEWPPFSGVFLPNKGMSLDVISAVLTRAHYDVDTAVIPWARIMDGAKRGDFDIVGSLFADSEVAKTMLYADPFFSTDIRFVQQVGQSYTFTNVANLAPHSISVGDGFLYEKEFDNADYLNKIVVTTALQAINMVAFQRADLTLDSADVINYAIQVQDPSLAARIEFVPGILTSQSIHMAVRKSHPNSAKIVADFNRTLVEMKRDGSLRKLISKHTGQ